VHGAAFESGKKIFTAAGDPRRGGRHGLDHIAVQTPAWHGVGHPGGRG
jgi:hypothetical protein